MSTLIALMAPLALIGSFVTFCRLAAINLKSSKNEEELNQKMKMAQKWQIAHFILLFIFAIGSTLTLVVSNFGNYFFTKENETKALLIPRIIAAFVASIGFAIVFSYILWAMLYVVTLSFFGYACPSPNNWSKNFKKMPDMNEMVNTQQTTMPPFKTITPK